MRVEGGREAGPDVVKKHSHIDLEIYVTVYMHVCVV